MEDILSPFFPPLPNLSILLHVHFLIQSVTIYGLTSLVKMIKINC
ncbi:hypothetical protein D082_14830 [Synechocystis sp. PCC 6714]|nr:hypothetical protein D082_14830 [Synechocystis sp. PCC 6714]